MKELSLLLLSDIHFGSLSDHVALRVKDHPPEHPFPGAKDIIASLIEALADSPPDGILVSGDLTSRACPGEFRGCVEAVRRVGQGLKIPESRVYYTYGNHDTNWRISGLLDPTPDHRSDIGYRDVAAVIGELYVDHPAKVATGPLPGNSMYETDDFQLFVLNSGYYNTHDQKIKHGRIGTEQLNWLHEVLQKPGASVWRILMLHHHPFQYPYPTPVHDLSTVEEGAEILDLVGRFGVHFVCHGHRHHPIHFTEMRNEWRHPVTFLCAGSMGVGMKERGLGQIPNVSHVIRLSHVADDGAAVGDIRTYEYSFMEGWLPVRRSGMVPIDPVQRFGSVASEREKAEAAGRIMDTLLAVGGGLHPLPNHGELPLALQCLPIATLNSLIRAEAFKKNCDIIGAYPADQRPYLKVRS